MKPVKWKETLREKINVSNLVSSRERDIGMLVKTVEEISGILNINSLPNDKSLDQTKLNEFKMTILMQLKCRFLSFDRTENIVEKGENAGYQHFLLFLQCFLKAFFLRVVKSRDCLVKG